MRWSLVCGLFFAGCAKQQQYQVAEQAPHQIYLENVEKSRAMAVAEDVLARMHFTLEKADLNLGFIKTNPLPGAQFFEFWRSDNIGSFNRTEANLHSIQRIIQLSFRPENEKLHISCDARVYKLSLPERQITSSTHAYEMFSRSSPSIQKLKLIPEQKRALSWLDLGQDKQLAKEILKRIEEKVKREE